MTTKLQFTSSIQRCQEAHTISIVVLLKNLNMFVVYRVYFSSNFRLLGFYQDNFNGIT